MRSVFLKLSQHEYKYDYFFSAFFFFQLKFFYTFFHISYLEACKRGSEDRQSSIFMLLTVKIKSQSKDFLSISVFAAVKICD